MEKIIPILQFLDKKEIDFRIVSNFCVSYIFYFLGGNTYPRRWYDANFEEGIEEITWESADNILHKAVDKELKKDWRLRLEAEEMPELFEKVEAVLIEEYDYSPSANK